MVILFDASKIQENIHNIVFATRQQEIVAKMLIDHIKENGGELSKPEMSNFAKKIADGITMEDSEKIAYNKKQFYDRILKPMKNMYMIEYDQNKKLYRTSDKFNQMLTKIGLMWMQEIRKPMKSMAQITA